VAELADAPGLGPGLERGGSSSLPVRTTTITDRFVVETGGYFPVMGKEAAAGEPRAAGPRRSRRFTGTMLVALALVAGGACGNSGSSGSSGFSRSKNFAAGSLDAPTTPPEPTVQVSADEFDEPALDPSKWTFVDPGGDSTQTMDGTHAEIHVPAASALSSHDPNDRGNRAPRLMQRVSSGNFSFDAKFDSAVARQFQEQGIIVEHDATHFVYARVIQEYFETSFEIGQVSGAEHSTRLKVEIHARPSIILRLTRTPDQWAVGYSYDGLRWTAAVAFPEPLTVKQIGVFAGTAGNKAPAFTAKIDFVRNTPRSKSAPIINVWYGAHQSFGAIGRPQPWVNILGDIIDPTGIRSLTYALDGGPPQPLSLGENELRLVEPGQFNAEIDAGVLEPRGNTVELTATDNDGNVATKKITVDEAARRVWPLPYVAQWAAADGNPNRVAQVADGQWVVQPDGTIRNTDIGYDRLVTLGDAATWTQYEVTAELTVNSMDPDGSAVGVVAGFTGAAGDNHGVPTADQPRSGHPYTAAFTYANGRGTPARAEIYANSAAHPEQLLTADTTGTTLRAGVAYVFEVRVTNDTTTSDRSATGAATNDTRGSSLLQFKVWPRGTAEPSAWLLQAHGDLNRGSIAILSHRADLSVGTVSVRRP
jgi:regulation of enolase protein 1 (concanavalin A-like superfamily)